MKWICIKDELPKDYQTIIVGRENETNVMRIITFKNKFIGKDFWGDCMESMFAKPTHWMPLPPPPSSSNSGYMVRVAKAILSQIAKATSYIRKRCRTFEEEG